jgi:hypothetical protein
VEFGERKESLEAYRGGFSDQNEETLYLTLNFADMCASEVHCLDEKNEHDELLPLISGPASMR